MFMLPRPCSQPCAADPDTRSVRAVSLCNRSNTIGLARGIAEVEEVAHTAPPLISAAATQARCARER